MGLLDLKTDLKSLRYGQDTPGGGDSGQPYIKSKIPEGLTSKSPDFLLRNGYLASRDALTDVARLTKMFFDLKSPNGLLFTAKQNVLSRTAVRTQTSGILNEGVYSPLNTLAQAGVIALGGHLNKQGINPFAQTGAYANNNNLYTTRIKNYNQEWLASPDGSLKNRLFALYESKIQNNEIGGFAKTNNISNLPSEILLYTGGPGSNLGIGNTSIRFADQRTGINSNKTFTGLKTWTPNQSEQNDPSRSRKFLDLFLNKSTGVTNTYFETNGIELLTQGEFPTNSTYVYGSGSEVGINNKLFNPNNGTKKTDTTENVLKYQEQTDSSNPTRGGAAGKWNFITSGSLSSIGPGNSNSVYKLDNNNKPNILTPNDSILYANGSVTYNQKQIEETPYGEPYINNSSKKTGAPEIQDFRKILREKQTIPKFNKQQGEKNGALAKAPDYSTENYERRVNIGGTNNMGPGNSEGKNLLLYTNNSGIGPIDKINALPIYRSKNVDTNKPINDLVKFRIAAIDNNDPNFKTFMHFRAFIDSFSDSYTGEWDSVRYIGRGEKFYNYKGFDRTISLAFTVAAQSKQELIPMYKKLNYLASNLAPDYSEFGYMRGPLIELTMGGYLYNQVGFITQLTYDIPEDSPWEIGLSDDGGEDSTVKELSHMIRVTGFSFTPIHNFVPQKQGLGFGGLNEVTTYGSQRYIALTAGGKSNYDNN